MPWFTPQPQSDHQYGGVSLRHHIAVDPNRAAGGSAAVLALFGHDPIGEAIAIATGSAAQVGALRSADASLPATGVVRVSALFGGWGRRLRDR